MKKSVIIVTSLVYIIAIVVVAFLGYVAEIHNPDIFAEDIVMVLEDAEGFPETPYTYYSNLNGAALYQIYYNENDNPDSEIEAERYRYRFVFKSEAAARFFFDYENDLSLNLKPYSPIGECTDQTLTYSIPKNREHSIEVDKEGNVRFKLFTSIRDEDITVRTNDGTDISIHINIYW